MLFPASETPLQRNRLQSAVALHRRTAYPNRTDGSFEELDHLVRDRSRTVRPGSIRESATTGNPEIPTAVRRHPGRARCRLPESPAGCRPLRITLPARNAIAQA
jgi:hypothetical protein